MILSKEKVEIESSNSPRFLWMIVCWGILLRLVEYLSNRSLWFDEATLADTVVQKSFSELLRSQDSTAPVGFLMLERVAVQVLGTSEYALRFFPFLGGVVSLLLFYRIAKRCVTREARSIALGLFASSGQLIYYSSEVKQYSSDVAIALSVWAAATYYQNCAFTAWRIAALGFLGAVAIWFSHPSVFVLAGVGMSWALFCLAGRRWAGWGSLSIVFLLWASSLVACYFTPFRQLSSSKTLLNYWSFGFMPSPVLSLATLEWLIRAFFGLFWSPAGLELSGVAALAFLIGCISLFPDQAEKVFLFTSPILLTLVAAGLHRYPFSGRLLLFLVPVLIIFIAEGAEQIRSRTRDQPAIGACLVGLLFLHPLLFSTYHLVKPSADTLPPGIAHTREEIKPVIDYLAKHQHEGDVLYVYHGAAPAFRYYAPRFSLNKVHVVFGGLSNWESYEKDLDQLRGHPRVWFLFSHARFGPGIDEEKPFLFLLDKRGTRLDEFKSSGVVVYLYDLAQATWLGPR